jgi:peroxiredoxin Q/BCP
MRRMLSLTFPLVLLAGALSAADLKVGDAAPDFQLRGTDGKTHKLSDMKGQAVVLAWFPKAFTGG